MTMGDFLYEVWDLIVVGFAYTLIALMVLGVYVIYPLALIVSGVYLAILLAVETGVL